jgi:hypothetical protein
MMKRPSIAIATLLSITTVAGLQLNTPAESRLEYLNHQSSIQREETQFQTSYQPSLQNAMLQAQEAPNFSTPSSTNLGTNDNTINAETVYPEYCRSFLPRSMGEISRIEYEQGLQRCQYGN